MWRLRGSCVWAWTMTWRGGPVGWTSLLLGARETLVTIKMAIPIGGQGTDVHMSVSVIRLPSQESIGEPGEHRRRLSHCSTEGQHRHRLPDYQD